MRLGVEALLLSTLPFLPSSALETRSSSNRPRGVGPEHAKFYKIGSDSSTFTCISNPLISIPFSRVNDDYCDCPDGSDEPGTAACSALSPLSPPQYLPGPPGLEGSKTAATNSTPVLPGFYCKNKGHIPAYLPFESVNDGRCDYEICCDGSDEWAAVGGTKCEDRCKQIGAEHRKIEESRQKALGGALKRRKELGVEAARIRKETELKITDLETEILAAEIKVKEATENLAEVERQEKLKVVSGKQPGGKLGVLVGLAKNRVTELRTALEKTRQQRDDMVARVQELEELLIALKTDYNPNFNDEGVKVAVRGWEDYSTRETDDMWSEEEDKNLNSILAEDSDSNGVNWAEFEQAVDERESDVDALYQVASYLPASVRVWIDETLAALRKILIENGILPDTSAAGSSGGVAESKAVQDAKKTLDDADKDLSSKRLDLDKHKEELEKDYGPDDVFRALVGQCVEKESGEYTYELCFLTQTKQKAKRGGAHTSLGNFVGFDIELVDEELPKDGKGLGKGERIVIKYENGQHCWNGPNRSTRVVLACSEKNEIWRVSESEKCVYRIEAGTAAVCGWRDGNEERVKIGSSSASASASDQGKGGKDEL